VEPSELISERPSRPFVTEVLIEIDSHLSFLSRSEIILGHFPWRFCHRRLRMTLIQTLRMMIIPITIC
jgi:hypothetical protein